MTNKILNPKRKVLDERLLRLVWLVAGKPGEEWADGPVQVPDGGGLPELEFNPAVAEALQIIETLDIETCASRPWLYADQQIGSNCLTPHEAAAREIKALVAPVHRDGEWDVADIREILTRHFTPETPCVPQVEKKFHVELVLTGGTKAVCLKAQSCADAETKAMKQAGEQIEALGFQGVDIEIVSVEEGR
jgi:hypothetical protein